MMKSMMSLKLALGLCVLIGYSSGALSNDSPKAANFDADFLAAHNSYRKLHGCGPLVYNATLNKFAQDYANILASKDIFKHSDGPYGENLYYSWSSEEGNRESGKHAVRSWYEEIKDYSFATGEAVTPSAVVGHFTQVVWKATTQLGVGAARSVANKIYVVGEYWPQGNYVGQNMENVPKRVNNKGAQPDQQPTRTTDTLKANANNDETIIYHETKHYKETKQTNLLDMFLRELSNW